MGTALSKKWCSWHGAGGTLGWGVGIARCQVEVHSEYCTIQDSEDVGSSLPPHLYRSHDMLEATSKCSSMPGLNLDMLLPSNLDT